MQRWRRRWRAGRSAAPRTWAAVLAALCTGEVAGLDTTVLPAHCEHATQLNFAEAQLKHNNLGGVGPDVGTPVIEYERIGRRSDGRPVSLIVSNTTEYTVAVDVNGSKLLGNQGRSGMLGQVNLAQGSSVGLRFQFINPVTRAPLDLENVFLSFLDLDHEDDTQRESVMSCQANAYYVSDTSEPPSKTAIKVFPDEPKLFCTTFQSTQRGNSWDDPQDPATLTPAQRSKGFSLQFIEVSKFEVMMGTSGPWDLRHSRRFLFAGGSLIEGCVALGTTTTSTTTTSTSTTTTRTTVTVTSTTTTSSTTTVSTTTTTGTSTTNTSTTTDTVTKTTTTTSSSTSSTATSSTTTTSTSTTTSTFTTVTLTTVTTTTTMSYWNCLVGPVSTWPHEQRASCCKSSNVGCPPGEAKTTPRVAYQGGNVWNCFSGNSEAWSKDKLHWCCLHENVGCKDKPFDCSLPDSHWHQQQRTWCCKFQHHGCEPARHNRWDCRADLQHWRGSWPDEKKAWCCRHEQLGCAFNCSERSGSMLEERRRFCCEENGTLCMTATIEVKDDFNLHAVATPPLEATPARSAWAFLGLAVLTLAALAALAVRRQRKLSKALASRCRGGKPNGNEQGLLEEEPELE